MATFRRQQEDFPQSPEGLARNTHVALSSNGTKMVCAANDRRVRVYERGGVADNFTHAANFDDQVGRGFITDVAITDNGTVGLIGDEDGRLVAFTTQVPLIAAEIETNIDCGRVLSCSISLNYVLASFYDSKRKRCRMVLWRRPHQNLTEGFAVVKIWSHNNIGDNYDLLFRSCTVRNNHHGGRIHAAIAYWTDRQMHYIPQVNATNDADELSQAFTRPPFSCRIVVTDEDTFVCIAADDRLIRFDPLASVPMSLHDDWKVDGVTMNYSLSISALLLDRNNLATTIALITEDQKLETYITS